MEQTHPALVVLGLIAVFAPFLAIYIWLKRYWARRSKELGELASRLGSRFSAESKDMPAASTAFGMPMMGMGRKACNVMEGIYDGIAFSLFDVTIAHSRNLSTMYTVGCFGSGSQTADHFVVTRGRGGYHAWPVLDDLTDVVVADILSQQRITLRAKANSATTLRKAEAIAGHFASTQNPSRSSDDAWFVEGSPGGVLLLYYGQCCPPKLTEEFIREGCALAKVTKAEAAVWLNPSQ